MASILNTWKIGPFVIAELCRAGPSWFEVARDGDPVRSFPTLFEARSYVALHHKGPSEHSGFEYDKRR